MNMTYGRAGRCCLRCRKRLDADARSAYCSEYCRRQYQNERRKAERRAAREAKENAAEPWPDPWTQGSVGGWEVWGNALWDAEP